jgi:MFS family permease
MKTRWFTICIVLGLVLVNYIDRSAISFAATPIREQFGISATQYGVISSAFSVGYMIFALLSGPLVDRFGPRSVRPDPGRRRLHRPDPRADRPRRR